MEREQLLGIIQATSKTPCSEADLKILWCRCQRIMNLEEFQRLERIKLTADENKTLFARDILLNCIGETSQTEKLWGRGLLAICYFVKVYKRSQLDNDANHEMLTAFIEELCKYNISWNVKPQKQIKYRLLLFTSFLALYALFTFDLNRVVEV